jgi:hypothetical protein
MTVPTTTTPATTTPPAWAHLPNAAHIDRILASERADPARWELPLHIRRFELRRSAELDIWASPEPTRRIEALHAARRAIDSDAGRDACLALIAWDDAGDLMGCAPEGMPLLIGLGYKAAPLLLPACIALNKS